MSEEDFLEQIRKNTEQLKHLNDIQEQWIHIQKRLVKQTQGMIDGLDRMKKVKIPCADTCFYDIPEICEICDCRKKSSCQIRKEKEYMQKKREEEEENKARFGADEIKFIEETKDNDSENEKVDSTYCYSQLYPEFKWY